MLGGSSDRSRGVKSCLRNNICRPQPANPSGTRPYPQDNQDTHRRRSAPATDRITQHQQEKQERTPHVEQTLQTASTTPTQAAHCARHGSGPHSELAGVFCGAGRRGAAVQLVHCRRGSPARPLLHTTTGHQQRRTPYLRDMQQLWLHHPTQPRADCGGLPRASVLPKLQSVAERIRDVGHSVYLLDGRDSDGGQLLAEGRAEPTLRSWSGGWPRIGFQQGQGPRKRGQARLAPFGLGAHGRGRAVHLLANEIRSFALPLISWSRI